MTSDPLILTELFNNHRIDRLLPVSHNSKEKTINLTNTEAAAL